MSVTFLMAPIYRPLEIRPEWDAVPCGWCRRQLVRGTSVADRSTRSGCLVYPVCEACDRAERYGEACHAKDHAMEA